MSEPLTPQELEALRRIPTPALSNAIELFEVRPRTAGFTSSEIICRFPELGPVAGYAATAVTTAASPYGRRVSVPDYWESVLALPGPRLAVWHDLDSPVIGAQWGEVQANIHRALGCVGAVSDGGVRDLDEARALGFQFFSPHVCVSHGYVHLVDFGIPVTVGGLEIRPGDLLVGDQHGVIQVPLEIAREVPGALRLMDDWERRVIAASRLEEGALEAMKQAYQAPRPVWRAGQP